MLVQNRQNRNGLFGEIRNYCDLLYLFMFSFPEKNLRKNWETGNFLWGRHFYSNTNTNIIFAVLKNRVINFYRKSCLGWFCRWIHVWASVPRRRVKLSIVWSISRCEGKSKRLPWQYRRRFLQRIMAQVVSWCLARKGQHI